MKDSMAIRKDSLKHHAARQESSSSSVYASSNAASDFEDNVSSSNSHTGVEELDVYDVICGRHKEAFNWLGNRRFRVTISLALDRYSDASTRKEKSAVIKSIADLVRANGGRFLHRIDHGWVELSEKQAHEKVGHALRDMAVSAAMKQESLSSRSTSTSTKLPRSLTRKRSGSNGSLGSLSKIASEVHCDTSPSESESLRDDSTTTADQEAGQPIEEVSIEPLPWKPQDQTQEEPLLDSGILSWLLKESDYILCDMEH